LCLKNSSTVAAPRPSARESDVIPSPQLHHFPAIRHPKFDVADRPFIVIWEVTRACDLVCKHCRAEAIPARNPAELTEAEGRALIDQVAGFGKPSPLLVLTGGDPMKRPDLAELIACGSGRNVPVAFSPSATPLLTAGALRDLRAAGLKAVSLSLDGATAGVHDAFRGIGGVFARTLELWDAALECGLKVQINTTVAQRNLRDLPAIARMLFERGAMTWSVFLLVPVGRATTLAPISARECEDVMNFVYDVGLALPTKTTEGHHYKRVVLERTVLKRLGVRPERVLGLGATYYGLRAKLDAMPSGELSRRTPMDVNAGRGFVFVSHVGTVHPSGFFTASAGDVRVKSLNEIYRTSTLLTELRDPSLLGGRCGQCEFAPVCGGSRSRAFATTGDALAEDPLCSYQPHSFPYQAELAELMAESAGINSGAHEHALRTGRNRVWDRGS
jgi:AdoMet-dependent heme synthase